MSNNIEREKWSESSKRSYAYHYGRATYEDISYVCRRCSIGAVFTGEEQKEAYEVKKNYIWQRRTLCSPCNAELYKPKVRKLLSSAPGPSYSIKATANGKPTTAPHAKRFGPHEKPP